MSKPIWPGVRRKKAKGKLYFYWTRVPKGAQWVRLPNPYQDADGFMRKMAECQRTEKKIKDAVRSGTFGALVKEYRANTQFIKKADNTKKAYNIYLDRLLRAYQDAPLVELDSFDIQKRVMDANQDTPGAANMMLAILKALYKFASKRHRNLEDWTAGIELYGKGDERKPWPADVLNAALNSENELFRRAVTLALYTGQRPGDVCAMTWNAIDGDSIRVRQEKTGTPMLIKMHDNLKAMLETAPRGKHLCILSNQQGSPLKPDTFRQWCKAETGEYSPHGLRKNAVNALFEEGCTTAEVASVTGHKSLAMLELYGRQRDQAGMSVVAMGKWAKKKS